MTEDVNTHGRAEPQPSLRDLTTESLHDALDVRAVRSLVDLVIHPGLVTSAYLRGDRTRYARPLQIYLLAAALFFVVNSFLPFTRIATSSDANGLHISITTSVLGPTAGYYMTDNSAGRPEPDDPSVALFEERFRTAVTQSMAPFMIGAILLFTLALQLFSPGAPLVTHAVFSLHWTALFLGIAAITRLLPGGQTNYMTIPMFAALTVHLTMSVKRVYEHRWPRCVATGIGLSLVFMVIIGVWGLALHHHARALAGSL